MFPFLDQPFAKAISILYHKASKIKINLHLVHILPSLELMELNSLNLKLSKFIIEPAPNHLIKYLILPTPNGNLLLKQNRYIKSFQGIY